jgi:voltage-gated potassium channel
MAFIFGRPPRASVLSQAFNQSLVVATLSVFVVIVGIVGYSLIEEEWGITDAIYMTAITVTTVGFGEVHGLSDGGRYFTIFLIFCGAGIWAYTFGSFSKFLLEGHFRHFFDRRRSEKVVKSMKSHIIVCGFGRMGKLVSREIDGEDEPFVVIEKTADLMDELASLNYYHINGDATEEEVLIAAGVEQAKSLIAVLPNDAENVYTALTSRALNPSLHIICRSENPGSEEKMKKAGADKVISPYEIGGRSLAHAALRPSVLSFFEMATTRRAQESLGVEELLVREGSPMIGQTLQQSRVRERFGVNVVAHRLPSGALELNPAPGQEIQKGTVLIVMGKAEGLRNMSRELLPSIGDGA